MNRVVPAAALLAAVCGCAAAIPYEYTKGADRTISFDQVRNNPDSVAGKKVVVGGEIIETKALKDETRIEILQKPLDYYDVPLYTDESHGRFLVTVKGFLDPQVFRSGRRVTVVGTVKGKVTLPLQGTEYTYPELEGDHIQLWPPEGGYYNYPPVQFGIGIYRWYPY